MSQMSHVPTTIAKATLSSLFDRIPVTIIPNVPCPNRSHTSPSSEWMSSIVAPKGRGGLRQQYQIWNKS